MMDAREEILYTYTAAADDRPVGKCVEEIVLYPTLDVSKGGNIRTEIRGQEAVKISVLPKSIATFVKER